jgi:hypothetical protein
MQIEELAAKKDGIVDGMLRAPRTDKVRVQNGYVMDPVYEAVQKMVDVYGARISRIAGEIEELYREMDGITRAVERAGLTGQEREYVRLRYFEGRPVQQVADKMGYCERWCNKFKCNACKKIEKCGCI